MEIKDILKDVNAYADAGLKPFRLKYRDKRPLKGSHGYKEGTSDKEILKEKFSEKKYNVALWTKNLFVIDVDDYEKYDKWSKDTGISFDKYGTLVSKTLKGKHYIFKNSTGQAISNRQHKQASPFPGCDIRGDHGYILVQPSYHPDDQSFQYSWEGGFDASRIKDFPQELWTVYKKWLKDKNSEVLNENTDLDELTLEDVENIIGKEYKDDKSGMVLGGDRHNYLLRASVALASAGFDQDDRVTLVKTLCGINCVDPEEKLADAEKLAITAQKYYREPDKLKPEKQIDPTELLAAFELKCDISYMVEEEYVEFFEFIIDEFMPKGVVGAIFGAGGSYKSMMMLQLCILRAMAVEAEDDTPLWLDKFKVNSGKSLYITLEDERADIHHRLQVCLKSMPLESELYSESISKNMFVLTEEISQLCSTWLIRKDKINNKLINILIEFIKRKEADLVYLENFSQLFGIDENSNIEAAEAIKVLTRMKRETGATILYGDHTGKLTRNGKVDFFGQNSLRGASSKLDNSRFGMLVERNKNNVLTITHAKAFRCPMLESFNIKMDWPRFELVDPEYEIKEGREPVAELLRKFPGEFKSIKNVAEEVDIDEDTVKLILREIAYKEGGKYFLIKDSDLGGEEIDSELLENQTGDDKSIIVGMLTKFPQRYPTIDCIRKDVSTSKSNLVKILKEVATKVNGFYCLSEEYIKENTTSE